MASGLGIPGYLTQRTQAPELARKPCWAEAGLERPPQGPVGPDPPEGVANPGSLLCWLRDLFRVASGFEPQASQFTGRQYTCLVGVKLT